MDSKVYPLETEKTLPALETNLFQSQVETKHEQGISSPSHSLFSPKTKALRAKKKTNRLVQFFYGGYKFAKAAADSFDFDDDGPDELLDAIEDYNLLVNELEFFNAFPDIGLVDILDLPKKIDDQEKIVSNLIIKEQTEEHADRASIYQVIQRKNFTEFKRRLKSLPKPIQLLRDSCGATLIHAAYLYDSYEIGRWLVRHYPELGLEPYAAKFDSSNRSRPETNVMMPYSGENILHITIIKRNHSETRWLLDFYRDHKDSVHMGLERLLTSNAVGSFFRRDGPFYFGGYPLHFAVCTNDTEMFDLVLSYASTTSKAYTSPIKLQKLMSTEKEKEKIDESSSVVEINPYKMLGRNAIFMRDKYGNTVLHLCVYHNLLNMYKHVKATAEHMVRKEIINKFTDYLEQDLAGEVNTTTIPSISLEALQYTSEHPRPAQDVYVIPLPILQETGKVDPKLNNEWLERESKRVLFDRLLFALNRDFLSPLTQAALGKGFKGTDEEEERKKSTLMFLIEEMKSVKWVYGPVTASVLELEGLDIAFNCDKYDRPEQVRLKAKTVLEILCELDSDTCIAIDDLKKIIDVKWRRGGYPLFLRQSLIGVAMLIVITGILCLINHTPSTIRYWKNNGIVVVTFLYPLAIILLLMLGGREIPYIWKYKLDYWGFYGGIRGAARFDKLALTTTALSFIGLCLCQAVLSHRGLANDYTRNQDDGVDLGISLSLAVCILSLYSYMYYFLMAFDSTGPFVLTIYRIISKNIPYFLQFYLIILFGFSCALSLITNNGHPAFKYGFWHLILIFWTLVRGTVSLAPSNDALNETQVPINAQWLYDILSTCFNIIVVVIFLNLLIAIISNTFSDLTDHNESLLLIEKYNILCSMERNMSEKEIEDLREMYTITIDDGPANAVTVSIPSKTQSATDNVMETMNVGSGKRYAFESRDFDPTWWDDSRVLDQRLEIKQKVILLVIDPQKDYGGEGSLPIPEFDQVNKNIATMIKENPSKIDEIYVSLDSRYRYNITSSIFWVDSQGNHPEPYTIIRHGDIIQNNEGIWIPIDASMTDWCLHYTRELERKGKFPLTIWPDHCILGTTGHAIVDEINEALQEWSKFSQRTINYVLKGQGYRTEMHSIFRADVEDPRDTTTALNDELITKLKLADRLLICGYEQSHGVFASVKDIVKYWTDEMGHIVFLEDASSYLPIYEAQAEELKKFCTTHSLTVTTTDQVFASGSS